MCLFSILLISGCMLLPGMVRACDAPAGGDPAASSCCSCSMNSVASLDNSDAPSAGAGNPINLITGNKYQREEDLPALSGVLGLEIVRHYNSAYSAPGVRNGSIGRGWRLSYETDLYDHAGKIQVFQADGGRVIFDRDPNNPSLCSTTNPAHGTMTLKRQANGLTEYDWTWRNGRRLHFSSTGKLESITAPTGESVTMLYDNRDVLVRVTDPYKRSLSLVYLDNAVAKAGDRFRGVQFIDSPVGRFGYEYGSKLPKEAGLFDQRQLLAIPVRVRLPTGYDPDKKAHALSSRGTTTSNASRIYHYENPQFPWLLTGISIEQTGGDGKPITTRFATFGYDSNGLANMSTHADNVGKVSLDTSVGGRTVLTNSLGQRTVYRYKLIGGEHRILEVRGAGCATCGETNVRYGYDSVARLTETTRLTSGGEPVSTTSIERDKLGRTIKVSKIVYQNGKPGSVQWLLRYAYQGDGYAPILIARPSVVPGLEVQTHIVYNDAGQPLSVTETGWIPSFDGKQAAQQITRTTGFRYATINSRSLLVSIDGPLPNGKTGSPADSDVTVFEYDNRSDADPVPSAPVKTGKLERYVPRDGLLSRIVAPGDLTTEVLERDEALRPIKLRTIDGDVNQVAGIRHNWRGQPTHIALDAGLLHRDIRYAYNAQGQVTTLTLPGNLSTTFEYDPAGRMRQHILPDGSRLVFAQDTEGHTASVARHADADIAIDKALSLTRYGYDKNLEQPSQLASIDNTTGALIKYRYNELGQIASVTDALGSMTRFGYDADNRLAIRTQAVGDADEARTDMTFNSAGQVVRVTAANDVSTIRRYDDFGRKVLETDPDHGATVYRYDTAGYLLARIDATGSSTRYSYDHANHLVALSADHVPNLLQYQYQGSHLTDIIGSTDGNPAHATERTKYRYDAWGQVIRETRWIAKIDEPRERSAAVKQVSNQPVAGLTFVTSSAYDEAGRLTLQTLPDGHRLQYRYAPARDTASQRAGQLEAILFDDSVIVDHIEQSIAGGLTGYTLGNGVRQRITLDRAGRIEQLQALAPQNSVIGWWTHTLTWLGMRNDSTAAPLYSQVNRYDAAGRLIEINRQVAGMRNGSPTVPPSEYFDYDRLDRLIKIQKAGVISTFRYDKGGNRISETQASLVAPLLSTASGTGATPASMDGERIYRYAAGSNRLIEARQDDQGESDTGHAMSVNSAAHPSQSTWLYHATGVPLAQWGSMRGALANSTGNRRTVYNSNKRPIAVYDGNDRLLAHYRYNSHGERIAKTVYPEKYGVTNYSLYREQRLAAETDSEGRITSHYIYLYGKPVTKIEMAPNESALHRFWRTVTQHSEPDASDTVASVYAIHTDHLGTPQLVSNAQGQVVWEAETSAFGQMRILYATVGGTGGKPFDMKLRLPGQSYDTETGLHYNYFRDYNPALGRFMTPDPIGLDGGLNPYAYALGNPIRFSDPTGLDVYVGNTAQVMGLHQKIAVDTPNGRYGQSFGMISRDLPQQGLLDSYGVTPQPNLPGSGEVYVDSDPFTKIQRQFSTTPAEDAVIERILKQQIGNTGPYNVASNSCRDYSNNQFDKIVDFIKKMRDPTPTPPLILIPNF